MKDERAVRGWSRSGPRDEFLAAIGGECSDHCTTPSGHHAGPARERSSAQCQAVVYGLSKLQLNAM